jgi:hypothetical protein
MKHFPRRSLCHQQISAKMKQNTLTTITSILIINVRTRSWYVLCVIEGHHDTAEKAVSDGWTYPSCIYALLVKQASYTALHIFFMTVTGSGPEDNNIYKNLISYTHQVHFYALNIQNYWVLGLCPSSNVQKTFQKLDQFLSSGERVDWSHDWC